VARLAGVSTTVVSYVINNTRYVSEQTRKKVLKAIKDLDYRPNIVARSLRSRRTGTVGLIICDLRNPFFAEVLQGIETKKKKKGYSILVTDTDYNVKKEKKAAEIFFSKQVEGIIIVPGGENNEHVRFLVERNIPVVLLDKKVKDNLNVDVVLVKNREGSKKLTEHLINLGHKRIGIITGPSASTTGKERLEGYLEALKEHSIAEDENLIKFGDFKKQSGYNLTLELLSVSKPPTVIYACNNLMGLGAMEALQKRKVSIPKEMGLVIFDDLPWFRYVDPPLTCVTQPSFDLGKKAAELLISRMARKRKEPREALLDVELRIRKSAGEGRR